MNKPKEYYVYEWYNTDSGEVFYVGKGIRTRYKQTTNRNKYFISYHKKYNCDVRIISENMTNYDALELEHETIMSYREIGQCKTNITDGGENPPVLSGERNGMFGKTHSLEVRDIISRKHKESGRFKGKGNSQYGVSPKERMDEETYKIWRKKQRARKDGSLNPNYGNKKLSKFYAENPDIAREKNSRAGVSNGRATPVAMYRDDGFYMEFEYMSLCGEYMIREGISKAKHPYSVVQHISSAAKNGDERYGHKFRFI